MAVPLICAGTVDVALEVVLVAGTGGFVLVELLLVELLVELLEELLEELLVEVLVEARATLEEVLEAEFGMV